jgi:uncharacterized protein YbjT (DUF2867 family)
MNIITGGTGQVGSALANTLLKKGEKVTITSRTSARAKEWLDKGANFAVADVYDTAALQEIFKTGKSIFILNPPADPLTNIDVQERKTVHSLLKALENLEIQKVVVQSTLGAQKGHNIGDLGVLYELEKGIEKLPYSYSIIRPAYYMSNWAMSLPTVKETNKLMSFYPADLKIPMVAPSDIGDLAAILMTVKNTPKLNSIEGPEMYSANDVAQAFSDSLGEKIEVNVIPRNHWKETYRSMGFSEETAQSYSNMTEISLNYFKSSIESTDHLKGKITIQEYINNLMENETA